MAQGTPWKAMKFKLAFIVRHFGFYLMNPLLTNHQLITIRIHDIRLLKCSVMGVSY